MKKSFFPYLGLSFLIIFGIISAITIHRTVTIQIGDQSIQVNFWGFKVSNALAAAKITITDGDIIKPNLDEFVQDGSKVTISRAHWVTIVADGEVITSRTTERSIKSLLDSSSIILNPADELWSNGYGVDPSDSISRSSNHTFQVIRATEINIVDSGKTQTFLSTADTLGDALWEIGIRLHNADLLSPQSITPLNGSIIDASLKRSQDIYIHFFDQVLETRVHAGTVGEALSASGMSLQGLDYSIPKDNGSIPGDGQIRVIQVLEENHIEQETIPFGVQFIPLPDISIDLQQVVQVGEYGILARKIIVRYEDGQEATREIDDEWKAKEPINRIIGYGTKINLQSINTADGNYQYWRKVDAYATSYSPCRIGVPGKCSNITASGAVLEKGVIGVIRSWFNNMKGLSVYIPGYGFGTIEDIGAGFSDRHWVDLGYSDEDWISWSGYVTVYFLTPIPANIMYILE